MGLRDNINDWYLSILSKCFELPTHGTSFDMMEGSNGSEIITTQHRNASIQIVVILDRGFR